MYIKICIFIHNAVFQFAIVFKTPPYRHQHINAPVEVNMFLRCPSKNQVSESKTFQYFPEDPGILLFKGFSLNALRG